MVVVVIEYCGDFVCLGEVICMFIVWCCEYWLYLSVLVMYNVVYDNLDDVLFEVFCMDICVVMFVLVVYNVVGVVVKMLVGG